MISTLGKPELAQYLARQLNHFFPDDHVVSVRDLVPHMDHVMRRLECCFSEIKTKYFRDGDNICFNHLHADQYAMFLYMISNTIYNEDGDVRLCSKVFQLNKCLHGIDVFYEVEMPRVFLFVHPLGTVLGRANYSDYFVVYQRCAVGSNRGEYPMLGRYVTMHPGSSIFGKCKVGDHCTFGANSLLIDLDIENDVAYFGTPNNSVIKKGRRLFPAWKSI